MAIPKLTIRSKTASQDVNSSGNLTALEFNELVTRVNEMIEVCNSKVYLTQDEYDALVANQMIQENVEYNIYDE